MTMNKNRKLISSDEAVTGNKQHTSACSDCPWRRDALNGWLGGHSVDDFLAIAHTDTRYDCHTIKGQQCAGMAIYRKNTCKRVEAPLLVLPADHDNILSNPMEFRAHHEAAPGTTTAKKPSVAPRQVVSTPVEPVCGFVGAPMRCDWQDQPTATEPWAVRCTRCGDEIPF